AAPMLSAATPVFIIVIVRVTETGVATRSVAPTSSTMFDGVSTSSAVVDWQRRGTTRSGIAVLRWLATVSVASNIATRLAGSQRTLTTSVSFIACDTYGEAMVGHGTTTLLRVQLTTENSPVIAVIGVIVRPRISMREPPVLM